MARKELFSIGEVSELFHISVSSLRHYENIGLLTPAYISPDSGYRYYGITSDPGKFVTEICIPVRCE